MERIAVSSGGRLRLTMVWSACASATATMTGSTDCSGMAPWAPRPLISMSKLLEAAMAGPGVAPTQPSSAFGQLWSA